MIEKKEIQYENYGRCLEIKNNKVRLVVTLDFGPRIIRYSFIDGENILFEDRERVFKELNPQMEEVYGKGKPWIIYGGHRLWKSPENMPETYYPDNNPVDGVDYSTLAHIMVSVGTEHLGLNMELTYSFKDAVKALQDGKVIISLQNPGCFTSVPNGHFVVFGGITEDGRILVNDPNGYTYARYPEYFADGFPQSKLWDTGSGYWIVTVADSTNSNIS